MYAHLNIVFECALHLSASAITTFKGGSLQASLLANALSSVKHTLF